MSQHNFAIANEAGAAFRGDVNSALQALASQSSGAAAPATTYAYQAWVDTTNSVVKRRNAANSAWLIRDTLSETFVLSRAANTILGLADYARAFVATAGFTQTLTAAATLGDGWYCEYRVEAAQTVTIDPNGAETIDGATTKVVVGPASGRIWCNGSSFFTTGSFAIDASKTQSANQIYAGPVSGGAAAPTFRAPVGADGASWVLLATATASASAQIDFASGITSTYDEYVITVTDYVPGTNATQLTIRISQDGGGTFKAGATDYKMARNALLDAASNNPAGSTGTTSMPTTATLSNTAPNSLSGWIKFSAPAGTASYKKFRWEFTCIDSGGALDFITGGGAYVTDTNAINGVRILPSSGSITSGTFALYGIRKA